MKPTQLNSFTESTRLFAKLGVITPRRVESGSFSLCLQSIPSGINIGKVAKAWTALDLILDGTVRERYGGVSRYGLPGRVFAYHSGTQHETVEQVCTLVTCKLRYSGELPLLSIAEPIAAASLRECKQQLLKGDKAGEIAAECIGLALIDRLKPSGVVPDRRPVWMAAAREYMHSTPEASISLNDIALAVGVDRAHLARSFRACNGITVGEYLRQLRLQRAIRELVETRKPLALIAQQAGFCDQSHFGRVFRSIFHASPASYRKENQDATLRLSDLGDL